jgi:toxin-antitoxin system PIN domain toxin
VIIPDVNLLLYATVSGFGVHERARTWLEAVLGGSEEVGLAAPAVFGFVRLATSRRVLALPMPVERATKFVEEWLERPQTRLLVAGPRHVEIAFGLLRTLGTAGNLTTDAQLAALAIEHRGTVYSNDADFARFEGVRWINPLV